jgi:hypothetical protein
MSDWERSTKEIPLESLPEAVISAIHKHIEEHNLGSILDETLMCIQTDSVQVKKSLFGKRQMVQVSAALTPRWLVWAIQENTTQPVVLSAQLINLTVQDYAQTSFAKMIPDSGIEVSGRFTEAGESASAFIGLGDGSAANKFKEIVIKTVQDAKK